MKKLNICFLLFIASFVNAFAFGWHINRSHFIENKGQWDTTTKYLAQTSIGEIDITKSGISYKLDSVTSINSTFVNSNWIATNNIEFVNKIPAKANYNYYLGSDSTEWYTDISSYNEIKVKSVYSNIDLKLMFIDSAKFRYDFVVLPGGNPTLIKMKFNGADSVKLDSATGFTVYNVANNLINSGLKAYQMDADTIKYIACSFIRNSDTTISFVLGNYDNTKTLIIDPVILSTYIRTASNDKIITLCANEDDIIYMIGTTNFFGNSDAFVIKYDYEKELITYNAFGGSSNDFGQAIAIDKESNIYITGKIGSSDFPLTSNSFRTNNHTVYNSIFVAKLDKNCHLIYSGYYGPTDNSSSQSVGLIVDNNGSPIVLGTYFFGKTRGFFIKINADGSDLIFDKNIIGNDHIDFYDIALKTDNNFFIYGQTYLSNTVTINDENFTRSTSNNTDLMLFEISNDGSQIVHHAFLGGSDNENPFFSIFQHFSLDNSPFKMTVDESNKIYLTGTTLSTDFWDGGVAENKSYEAFLIKINSNDFSVAFAKAFGGDLNCGVNGYDLGIGIALDKNNNIYITGITYSGHCSNNPNSFPITKYNYYNSEQVSIVRGLAFLTIFSNDGQTLLFSSYLHEQFQSGDFDTYGSDIIVKNDGKVFIVGNTMDPNLSLKNAISKSMLGDYNGFLMMLTPFPDPVIVR